MSTKLTPKRISSIQVTEKQAVTWEFLNDKVTTEILYGGAAGGGKTLLGCLYGIYMSMHFKDIRGCMAREELKSLKESTLLTFFDVCKVLNLKEDIDYVYYTDSHILFPATNSTIYLKELKYYPSDPEYDYLGSTEYTWAFIDEASQVRVKAKNILLSRIRYKLTEYNLVPKLFMTCNPHKGYLYTEFYKPDRDGKLQISRRFVQALPGDNPTLPESYLDTLRGLDKQSRERLLFGNWEYDDDPATLCEYEGITDMFTNVIPPTEAQQAIMDKMKEYNKTDPEYLGYAQKLKEMKKKYIIADIARFGDDRTVITYWEGWECRRIAAYTKLPLVPDKNRPDIMSSAEMIDDWRKEYGVGLSQVLVDEDGVGGGPKDWLGCRGFVANRTPLKVNGKIPNYVNLKAQCSYYLASKVNSRAIAVHTQNVTIKTLLSEEMEYIKAKDRDKDKKLSVVPKDDIKKMLGRSPDFADTLMMRAYFDLIPMPGIRMITLR